MKRKASDRGFSLIELIIVVTLLGIIGIPIVQGVIDAVKTNAESKRKLDATVLAGKLSETIEVGGIDAVQTMAGRLVPSDPNAKIVGYNNNEYLVKWNEMGADDPTAGSYYQEGYSNYYQLEINSDNISLTKKVFLDTDGSEQTESIINAQRIYSTTNRQMSLVFKDGELDIYPYESLTGLPGIIRPDDATFKIVSDGDDISFRIVNKRTPEQVNLKLYNLTTAKTLNIFYDSVNILQHSTDPDPTDGDSDPEDADPSYHKTFNINFDKNIVLRDINAITDAATGESQLSFDTKIYKTTYEVKICRPDDSAQIPIVTRTVTAVSKTDPNP